MKTGTGVQTPLLAAKFCVCAAACSFCRSSKTVLVVLIYRMFGRPVRGEQSSKKGREVSNVLCTLPMRARPNATRTCREAARTEIAPARAQQCLPPAGCAPTKEGPLAACGQREVKRKAEALLRSRGAAMLCVMWSFVRNPVCLPLLEKVYRCEHETLHQLPARRIAQAGRS